MTLHEMQVRIAALEAGLHSISRSVGGRYYTKMLEDFENKVEELQHEPALQDEITPRDYFAAKAMQSKLLCEFPEKLSDADKGLTVAEFIAKQAYAMADAMLKARQS